MCDERWRHRQMGGGATRGDGATKGGGASRTRRGHHSRWHNLISTFGKALAILSLVRQKLCQANTKKHSHIWDITNHKSQICDCDSQTQLRYYGNSPFFVYWKTLDWGVKGGGGGNTKGAAEKRFWRDTIFSCNRRLQERFLYVAQG